MRNKMMLVARQEFKMTAANKAFIIITFVGPLLIFGVSVLPSLLSFGNAETVQGSRIGLYGGDEELLTTLRSATDAGGITLVTGESRESLKKSLEAAEINGYLVAPDDYLGDDPWLYYSRTATDIYRSETVSSIVAGIVVHSRLTASGLDPALISSLTRRPVFRVHAIGAAEGDAGGSASESFVSVLMTAIFFIMLVYMTVLLYGQMIGRSVVKEKLSKTVDIMLSSVQPKQLLFGKILGIGAAGILQYAFWILVAAVLIRFLGPAFDISLPEAINLTNFLYMAAFFITAYFLYASAYAALGSASEDEQHLGQLAWPLLLFLIVPLVMISPIVMNPSSTFIRVLSLFPMSSPLVMLVRVLVEPPPAWELILCFALLLAAIYLFATLAAKIFRTGILMTGKRPTIGEIVRWVK